MESSTNTVKKKASKILNGILLKREKTEKEEEINVHKKTKGLSIAT